MFGVQNRLHSLNIFKWKPRNKSSLTIGLLDVPQHEIELSDYKQAPSPTSDSPSGFLDDGTLNSDPIDDPDLFFERIYHYYCEKGLWCIIIKWIFELLSLAFTICFSGFFLLYVDWNGLRNAKCGMDAVESGIKPCDLSKEALHEHPLTPLTLSKAIIVGYLGIFTIYWIFCFLRFFAQLKETLKIRLFYYNSLHVTDNEIKTMPWEVILEKLIRVQRSQQLCVVKDLSIHDVVMRLMRKENYLIGMLNKGVLALPISGWVPGSGTGAAVGPNGVRHRLVLPKTLEWTLNWCILQSMFDRNFHLRRDFTSDPSTLKKRLVIVGFVLLLLSPFLIIFMVVYLFLRHAEQFYNHPSTASSRRWSNLSKWMFREYNEVDHLFKHRINSSVVHASDYLKQFPSPILTIVAKFISFVSGGFAAVLIIIAFLEESLLEGHIFGRNLFWYAAVFGTITAISRAAIADELLVLDPQGTMSQVVQHTHYMPKRWRGKENTEAVRVEFETLFQYTGMMLLEEIASIFVTPYLLIFIVPKRVDDILHFIVDFTENVPGVGDVCSFSLFNFERHGNKKYGSPFDLPRAERSSQGKMEKSFLSFQISYPSWEPNEDGKQFLATLKLFRDQKLRGQAQSHQNPNFDRNSDFARDPIALTTHLGNYNQFDSMWLIDGEQKNFPYILDWYYTSQNHDRDVLNATPTQARDHYNDDGGDVEAVNRNYTWWDPPPVSTKYKAVFSDQHWDDDVFDDRAASHLQASTSIPLFRESILRHQHEPLTDAEKSQWWARTRPQGSVINPTTSFLEPPNFFNRSTSRDFNGSFSGRIVEDEEEHGGGDSDSRELSRTVFMSGGFNLPFDIYSGDDDDPANLV